MPTPASRRRRAAVGVLALTTVGALTFAGLPQGSAAPPPVSPNKKERVAPSSQRERKGDYDARVGSPRQQLQAQRDSVARQSTASKSLIKQLGSQSVVDIDNVTGTPRTLGRLDGFLTKRSHAKATTIVMRYVRAHAAALNLTQADLKTFTLRQDYVDVAGIHHISWTQSANGVTVFGNGLKANVTKHGQIISLQGAPVPGLAAQAARADAKPALTATRARTTAAKDVGGAVRAVKATSSQAGKVTRWANHDQAQLVWFATTSGLRLGWSTYVQAGGDNLSYQHVIDARTGAVLYRHDTVDNDHSTNGSDPVASQAKAKKGDALVYANYPGAPKGGKQKVYNLITHKLISKYATTLTGNYVNAFSDVNDDNVANPGETVAVPGTGAGAQYKLVPFNNASGLCSSSFICTWNPNQANSWQTNRAADATQAFYFDSIYHNYLLKKPFGFTRAAGNFESRDGDAVQLNALDGADTANGLPDANHIDNANMATPPDGFAPTMQMYLWHAPGATAAQDAFLPTSGAFDSSVILHEYTHGLSNRLVVDASGNSTLNSIQAGSMGEAWSDYYAMDYLINKGLEKDTSTPGDVLEGKYVDAGTSIRSMGIDCPVKTSSTNCSPIFGGTGGYTYGDFSKVAGSAEVHASGEIWAQTLWDLRKRFGHKVTGMLVTRAMELSPSDPSFLDMRNAIVQADLAVYGGKYRTRIWRTFANRGMGFFAGTRGSADALPAEDFSTPPAKGTPRATVSGTVTEGLTGKPLAGALVAITGHDSGYVGDYSDVSDATGHYSIPGVFVGTYPLVTVSAPGYEPLAKAVTVVPRGTSADFTIRRDWAASSGGAAITDFTGPDFTAFSCGPSAAIDSSQATGWGSTTGDDNGTPTNKMIPKTIVVKLPAAITLSSFSVDPSSTCGDGGSASTGAYRIETSSNGSSWTAAASGTFTAADRGRLNNVAVASPVTGVSYVRFTMLSPQVPDFATNCPAGAYDGCQFTDMTELEAFGTAK